MSKPVCNTNNKTMNSTNKIMKKLTKRILSKKKKSLAYTSYTNIAVFGSSHVGKTQIINSFATSIYGKSTLYKPTFTECYERNVSLKSLDGTVCKHDLSILDTSGSLRYDYPNVYKQAIYNCEAFILVFSMDDKESLNEIENILEDIITYKKSTNIPILVIGNKFDLVFDKNTDQMRHRIKRKLSQLSHGCTFEKSALHPENGELNECFISLLNHIEKRKGIERSFSGIQIVS